MATIPSKNTVSPLNESLMLMRTPEPPYVLVVSTSIHHGHDMDKYNQLLEKTFAHADEVEGYLGMEAAKETLASGKVYTVAAIYFTDMDAFTQWRNHPKHTQVKTGAKDRWFAEHNIRICEVKEHYGSNLTHP